MEILIGFIKVNFYELPQATKSGFGELLVFWGFVEVIWADNKSAEMVHTKIPLGWFFHDILVLKQEVNETQFHLSLSHFPPQTCSQGLTWD